MRSLFIGVICLMVAQAHAQVPSGPRLEPVQSIDGIVKEVLKIVSGEKGQARDWETFRSLFLPTAHLTVKSHDPSQKQSIQTVSLEEFIQMVTEGSHESSFQEYELGKTVDEYNGIAQVFQAYYSKDGEQQERGINSYQLVYSENRWWIANIIWTGDSNGVKIPKKYLRK